MAKALAATNTAIDTFVQLIHDRGRCVVQSVPLLGLAQAGSGGYFDDGGFPAGKGWDEVGLPSINDEHAYALEISGNSMKPAYRDGDIIVVSPGTAIRRGDRVVVKTVKGEVMVKELKRRAAKVIELASLNPSARRPDADNRRRSNGSHASSGPVGRAARTPSPLALASSRRTPGPMLRGANS